MKIDDLRVGELDPQIIINDEAYEYESYYE